MKFVRSFFSVYVRAYSGLPAQAWLLSLVEFINRSGFMVFFFLTLYMTRGLGFSLVQAGQAVSAFGLGSLPGSFAGGWLSDRIGPFRVQKISLALNGALLIILGTVKSFVPIIALMAVLGMVSEALHPANATAMSLVCSAEKRTRGFALNRLATNLGITIGPALGGFLALVDYKLLFWVDGLTCLAAFLVFHLCIRPIPKKTVIEQKRETLSRLPSTPLIRDRYFLAVLLMTFFQALGFVQLFSTFPLYMRNIYGLRESSIGFLLSINTIIIVLFEMILLEKLKHIRLNRLIAWGMLFLGTGFALMPLGRGFLFAGLTVAVWTFGEMISMPTLTTLVANHAPDHSRGRYMGLFSLAFALAMLAGPTLGTWIYSTLGPAVLWMMVGITGVLLFWGFHLLNSPSSCSQASG